MTATKPLVGRYKLYKAGTSKLVNWLSNTGSRCCDLKKVLKSLSSGTSTKKQSKKSTREVEVEVSTQELLKLAQIIVDSGAITVPPEIIDIAREVIAGRENAAEWYSAQALSDDGSLEQENNTHRYFIKVLQRVLHLLLHACVRQPTQTEPGNVNARKIKETKSRQTTSIKDEKLTNLFTLLHLDEPWTSTDGDEPPTYHQATTAPHVNYKLSSEDDASFATWCFLQDLDDLRVYVMSTWLEYSKGEISFLVASSVTDTAFGLLRCADEDFEKNSAVGQSTDFDSLLKYFNLTWTVKGRVMWLCPDSHGSTSKLPDSDLNIVKLLCPIGLICLLSFSTDARAACHAARDKKPIPTDSDNNYHKFHEFCRVLFKLTPELHDFSHSRTCEHVVVDEFVHGLAQFHHNGKASMWLVVACQIYLDIYDMLGTNIDHGADALQQTFQRNQEISSNLTAYCIETGYFFADAQDAVEKLGCVSLGQNRFEKLVLEGCDGKYNVPSTWGIVNKTESGSPVSPMEQNLPAHAGAVLADMKYGLLDAGCKIANSGSIVLSTAHLYKALRAMGVLKLDWPDMDFVLSSFKTKQPLVAKMGSSYDGDAAVRRYLMALGVDVMAFASDARKTGKLKEPREVIISSPLLQKMADRQANWKKHGIGYSKSRTIEVVLQTLTRSDATSGKHPKLLDHSFTPTHLLATFKKTIQTEEPQLNFDHVSFTVTCARLLDETFNAVGASVGISDLARSKLGTKALDESHSVDLVAGLLRCNASSPQIATTADLVSSYISSKGRTYTQQAFDQSSGRIPKALRPKIEHDLASVKNARNLMCTMLDCAGTKYVFSGRAMSAYHPRVAPELCKMGCCCESAKENSESVPKVVNMYDSELPDIIMDEAMVNIAKEPQKMLIARNLFLKNHFEQHAEGIISEKSLRERVKLLTTFEIGPMSVQDMREAGKGEDAFELKTPWEYVLTPGTSTYDEVFWKMIGVPQYYGMMLTVPVDVIHASMVRAEDIVTTKE